jgi:hypothetical protein
MIKYVLNLNSFLNRLMGQSAAVFGGQRVEKLRICAWICLKLDSDNDLENVHESCECPAECAT